MSKALAERVDVTLLALQGASLERQWPLADLTRLGELLLSNDGSAVARFAFQQVEGMPAVEAAVRATVQLRCQRCLRPYGCRLESTAMLVFTTSDAEAGRVPEGWEAITVDAHRVALAELVEDELLLSLPIVPMHSDAAACEPAVALAVDGDDAGPGPDDAPQRPFAQLKELLKH
jgi:uncharacterized protein